jgi:hypothetical protein
MKTGTFPKRGSLITRLAAALALIFSLQGCLLEKAEDEGGDLPDYSGSWVAIREIFEYRYGQEAMRDTVDLTTGDIYEREFFVFRNDSIFVHSHELYQYASGPSLLSARRLDGRRWKIYGASGNQSVRFILSPDSVLKMEEVGGDYHMEFVRYSGPVPPVEWGQAPGELDEPNDLPAQATLLNVDSSFHHAGLTQGDDDYYRFTAQAGTTYYIETQGYMDTYLRLFSTDGTTFLDSDDDGGEGNNALITWKAPSSGTYYFAVDAYSEYSDGPYSVGVTTGGVVFRSAPLTAKAAGR